MKKIGLAITALFFMNTSIMAQRGFEIEKEIVINVSADELWEMVGPGFVDVYKWASNVDHAVGSGAPQFEGAVCSKRSCDVSVAGFDKIHEELTKYDASAMNLAYTVYEGMPKFVTKANNDWTVVPMGDGRSKLVMKADFGTKGFMGFMMNGMMKSKMDKTLDTVLMDAKIYAEQGKPSLAKRERVEKLKKKKRRA